MAAAVQLLPHLLAQVMVRHPPIGHLQGQLQTLIPQIKCGAGAIEHPAPAAAAVFPPVGVPAEADHAGAADQDDSSTIGECPPQRGAFVAGGEGCALGKRQSVRQQCCGSWLQRGALFDSAGANHGGIQLQLRLTLNGSPQAGADGLAEPLVTAGGIEVGDPRT